jgi:hypothetical protein
MCPDEIDAGPPPLAGARRAITWHATGAVRSWTGRQQPAASRRCYGSGEDR